MTRNDMTRKEDASRNMMTVMPHKWEVVDWDERVKVDRNPLSSGLVLT